MTFIVGRGFAKRQILKKWKWPYPLNWVEYFDKLLRKHWYWQDPAQEIAKWHFSLVETLPRSKFWKSDNGAISWTEWNIVMKFCIHIDIDKMYSIRLSNDIWDRLSFCGGSNSEKSETIAKWHLSSVEALPSAKFWKSENGLISWTEWNILTDFCVNIYIIRSNPRDCEMSFFIGLGFAELQILKKWKWPYLLNWVKYWDEILHTHWYWQDVAHEMVKWHLGLVEVLPMFKFWKKWTLTIKPSEYFDKILQTMSCWKDLAQGIAK